MTCIPEGYGLIFDLDGVIVDSMPLHTAAWRLYLERMGIACEDIESRMHGRRNDEIVADFIAADLAPDVIARHGAAKEELYREMMRTDLRRCIVPGVEEFLASCRGVPVALASNAEPANVAFILDGAGLRDRFQVIVDGHQVERPKPAPDVYLRAARLLSVSIGHCIVFEDSPAGVTAARSAGAKVVGVQTHPVELPGVDLLIRDFRDAALKDWLEIVEPPS